MWEGYMLYHSASYDLETTERVRPVGSYIVGHVGKTGLVHFSKVPHRHASKRQGKEEALRLVEEHKKNFGLFRCIELFKSPVPEAE
ncbi:hypothetical protein MZD04_gp006 [Pseudomonas phage Psa21]|uniref:Uncharacterized protein n=1 Tax=Pseudomonas phage Psa21 TaxID=2530023 RepID=A0A481W4A9_9CAUD|nr:hypothetical protein MZD04_gp006 [Pseudomonas phage Psa21]QBJ02536.1 hypothetical protein PSA21_6 [Pseudomonas phage Psa21]